MGDVRQSSDPAAVLALGCTCRALLGHCLRVLWSEMDGLDDLIKTLPSQTWQYHREGALYGEDLPIVSQLPFGQHSKNLILHLSS